jgi:hypothetical protein
MQQYAHMHNMHSPMSNSTVPTLQVLKHTSSCVMVQCLPCCHMQVWMTAGSC